MTTLLTPDTNQLRKIADLPTELALRQAATFLAHLVKDPDFLESLILPLLVEARSREDWYVAHRHGAEDGSFSLQVFVWPPGTRTKIHDHSAWGAYYCAIGSVLEERYERLDDSSHPEYARLKKVWQLSWTRGCYELAQEWLTNAENWGPPENRTNEESASQCGFSVEFITPSSEDGASTVQPRDGGIHRVVNPGESTAISVHLYGPRIGEVDGRDYDPSRDYVCDRRED